MATDKTVALLVLVASGGYILYKLVSGPDMEKHTLSEVTVLSWDAPGSESRLIIGKGATISHKVVWQNTSNHEITVWFRMAVRKSWDFWTGWPSSYIEGQYVSSTAASGQTAEVVVSRALPGDWEEGTTIDLRLDLYGEEGGILEVNEAYKVVGPLSLIYPITGTPVIRDVSNEAEAQLEFTWHNTLSTNHRITLRLDLRTSPGGAWLESPYLHLSDGAPDSDVVAILSCPLHGGIFDSLSNQDQMIDVKVTLVGREGAWWGPPGSSAEYQDPVATAAFEFKIPVPTLWVISTESDYQIRST